jgi:Family of unknown function (DUF6159)
MRRIEMGRIGRSFALVGQSYRILMQDKELMVLPLISGAIIAAVLGSALFGIGLDAIERHRPGTYLPLFLTYVVIYAVGIFFQAAIVAGATERMRGGDPTVASALAAASRRAGSILLWAVVAATVGMLLRSVEQRAGVLGKIAVRIVGGVWSLATFFVVPVLVLEERSVRESFTRSVTVFKRTWGETVVGGTSLGMAAVCAWVTLVAVVALLAYVIGVAAVAVLIVGGVFLMIFFSALQGIYVASLFRYATEGPGGSGFDGALLKQAFVPKQ